MKKLLAAVAAGLVLLAGGSALVVRSTTDSASCPKPLTLLGSEQTASIAALEKYMSENYAPTVKDPQYLGWESDDYSPILLPNKIAAYIVVYNVETTVAKRFHITMTRDCQGGDWKVVEFRASK